MRVGETSFHLHSIGANAATRPPLSGDRTVDVCIVGAGFTGLWTAWWLRQVSPQLSIAIIEANRVGYGASGRNLGWISGKMVGHRDKLADTPAGREGVIALRRACIEAVTEIPRLMQEHGVDIDAAHGGYLQIAQTPAGLARVHRAVADRESWRLGEDDIRFLDRGELSKRIAVAGALGALYSPHCTRIQPAKLAVGLAGLLDGLGVEILEQTAATQIRPGLVETARGNVRARVVLRATEAYSCKLPGLERSIIPTRTSVVATTPLTADQWNAIGWSGVEGIYGSDHLSYFGSRTADGRILLGSVVEAPYRYGSGTDKNGEVSDLAIRRLKAALKSLFPSVDLAIDHVWCGVLGTPRDWSASVSFDSGTGLGHSIGYAGQGVGASYLAGRTLADLVAGKDSRWTRLPWTNRIQPRWEPEPIRWLGARAMYGLYRMADWSEQWSGSSRTSLFARIATAINKRP